MIINDSDAQKRLSSPMNLCYAGKSGKTNAMSLFGLRQTDNKQVERIKPPAAVEVIEKIEPAKPDFNPFSKKIPTLEIPEPPTPLEAILDNSDSQIKLGLAHDKALNLLIKSVDMIETKLDDVSPGKLPSVAIVASKVVESIRRERNEAEKNKRDREVHYHFYTPEQKKISEYEVIDVG